MGILGGVERGVLLFLLLPACGSAPDPGPAEGWSLGFYVPYDNDLGPYADRVIQAIARGTAGGVPAVVLADTPGDEGVTLWRCAGGTCAPEVHPGVEDSSDPKTFQILLDELKINVTRRYGIVILNHGGAQAEVARDDAPGAGGAASWLHLEEVAQAVSAFDASTPGEVGLLVTQVCAKAALQPLYTLRHAAPTLLASELPLASPNLWPRAVLPQLAAHPEWDGEALATAIVTASDPAVYGSYTCVRSAGLEPLASGLLQTPGGAPLGEVARGVFAYGGEAYVDLGLLLDAQGVDRALLSGALCGHHVNPAPRRALIDGYPDPGALSGLSLALTADPRLSIQAMPGWADWEARVVDDQAR